MDSESRITARSADHANRVHNAQIFLTAMRALTKTYDLQNDQVLRGILPDSSIVEIQQVISNVETCDAQGQPCILPRGYIRVVSSARNQSYRFFFNSQLGLIDEDTIWDGTRSFGSGRDKLFTSELFQDPEVEKHFFVEEIDSILQIRDWEIIGFLEASFIKTGPLTVNAKLQNMANTRQQ